VNEVWVNTRLLKTIAAIYTDSRPQKGWDDDEQHSERGVGEHEVTENKCCYILILDQ